MPTSITPLNARSQTLISVLLGIMAVMGLSPIAEAIASKWPLRFGELLWRYDLLATILLNAPQLIILTGLIAVIATMAGYRAAVRAAAVVFGAIAAMHVLLIPLLMLDYFQLRRIFPATRLASVKAVLIKLLVFAVIATASAAWGALRAWQASEREGAGLRRQKGEGLVVGQPKAPRPAE